MRFCKVLSILFVVSIFSITAGQAFAQYDQGQSARVFGLGQPHSAQDLPVGKLRNRLESLPPQARGKALRWLQDFSFPESDLANLRIDDTGGVFYVDTRLPDPDFENADEGSGLAAPEAAPQSTLDDVFLLHSKPGAPNVVFIDFDGAVISGTAWNNGNVDPLIALPYNVEGDGSTFTNLERTRMVDIWHRVAEDLAPFDIDVTTEEPTSFNSQTGTLLITHTVDQNGNLIYCSSCGGVAYVGVFGNSNYHTYYSPALVFWDKLGNGNETYVAEAGSHEFGHNLGLSHDGLTSGTTYYSGHGSGLVSWAPIMGVGYYNNVTQWSKGEYTDANQTQDDLAIIDGKLGYDSDDHGDTLGTASALTVDPSGQVVSSNPELDPHNLLPENKGVIGSDTDVDVFSFVSGAGSINLTVNPAWDAFYRSTTRRGANLDIEAELQDLNGNQVDLDDPLTDTNATVSATVGAGTYHLLVTGVGNNVTPYSDYGSLGMYFINGSVPPSAPDTTAPTPNPMTWASAPAAISDSAISMTASTATDETSSVEYNFQCTVGGAGCTSSGWQSGTSHTATGLAASTSYTFHVTARDQSLNETAPSVSESATTDAPPPPPLAPSGLTANGTSETTIDLAWTDNASTETSYRVERSDDGANDFTTIANLGVDAENYTDSGLTAGTTYDYRVAAVNGSGDSGFATASGTTDDAPSHTNYGANSDTPVSGTVSGSYTDTQDDGGAVQSIRERESGGRKSNRHSFLQHRWNFNINSGATVTVYANAWSGGSTDDDTFDFEYSTDNGNSFQFLFNVSSESDANLQSAALPNSTSGAVIIRVVDTDQTQGNRELNTVFVDHLYIQVGTPSADPPDGDPSNLQASAVSSSRIDLTWTDGTSNESGFKVERRLDTEDPWVEIDDIPAGSESFNDTGLSELTQYFYRVYAYNLNGDSADVFADATTLEAPALSLIADGYKVKGKHHVALEWTGSASVDVYRDDVQLNPVNVPVTGSSYIDNIGTKGGATYTHKVCNAGTNVCSNTTTTVF